MFGRDRRDSPEHHDRGATATHRDRVDATARGGISGGALATGVVVAQGAMLLLTALVGAALVSAGQIAEGDPAAGLDASATEIGIGVAIAFLLVQFLAYMWGGHTAARMARGAGLAHGLLVPLISLLLALAIGAIAAVLQANAALNLPFGTGRLPLEGNYEVTWGIGAGVAALVAMFLGGALGGMRGEHWHTRLERDAGAGVVTERDDRDVVHDDRAENRAAATTSDDSREVTTGGMAGREHPETKEHDYDTEDVQMEREERSTPEGREVDVREEHHASRGNDDR
ncbi:MAG: hypothetical protein ACR2KQ_05500 [Actinomycetota bacterium]